MLEHHDIRALWPAIDRSRPAQLGTNEKFTANRDFQVGARAKNRGFRSGTTYCPDVCPTSLALIAQALSGLAATEQQQVQAFFISVDPRRDSAERLQEYAPFFHPTLIGLSGTPQEIARVAAQYGASYQAQPPNAQEQYSVDHSSATYLIDTQGKLALTLPHASTSAQLLAAIREHLAAPVAAR